MVLGFLSNYVHVFLVALSSGTKTLGWDIQNNASKMVLKTLEMLAFSKCKFSEMRFWENEVEWKKRSWWISEEGIGGSL
jgi:hypothetical protein